MQECLWGSCSQNEKQIEARGAILKRTLLTELLSIFKVAVFEIEQSDLVDPPTPLRQLF